MSQRIVLTLDDGEYELFKKPQYLGNKDSIRAKNIIMNWLLDKGYNNLVRLKKEMCGMCGKETICYELLEDGKNWKYACNDCLMKPSSSDLREKYKNQIDFKFRQL